MIAVAAFTAFGGFLFLNTLYLQEVAGPLGAQRRPLHATAGCHDDPRQPDRRPRRRRARRARAAVVGGLGLGAGSLMLVSLSAGTSLWWLLVAYAVFGLGFGAVNTPITNVAVSGMPPSQAGVAAAVATTSRQVGLTLGVAIVGAIATARVDGTLHDQPRDGQPPGLVADRGHRGRNRGTRPGGEHQLGPGQRRADGGAAARGAAGGVMAAADEDLARRAWRAMSESVHDHDRKVAVSEALGLSWARVLALRRLAAEPHTLRALAERLAADPPYVTLIVHDLEQRGLVRAEAASRGPAREARGADCRRPRRRGTRRGDAGRAAGRDERHAGRGPRGPAARARAPGRTSAQPPRVNKQSPEQTEPPQPSRQIRQRPDPRIAV